MYRKVTLSMVLLLLACSLIACRGEKTVAETPTAVAVEPTFTPASDPAGVEPVSDGIYHHPSGVFSVNQLSSSFKETDSGVAFFGEGATVMVIYGEMTKTLTSEAAIDLADEMADAYLSEIAESYTTFPERAQAYGGGHRIALDYAGGGGGEIFLVAEGKRYVAMLLLADEGMVSEEQWLGAVNSLTLKE